MNAETEDLPSNAVPARTVDAFDRRILGALIEDARLTYAEIGKTAGLSAPAVHERVKRLKASGVLKGMAAAIDGSLIGKPLLAFVHVDADGWGKSQRMLRLKDFPEVEEMHSVAGDTSVILKVRTASPHALEHLLAQIYALPGVRATKSFIALSTYLERPVQAAVTADWPEIQHPK
ncbi:Lrp/AsnC family transcriptional regulator [Hoeflea sp.]|uniref:Lrp/AsnC family transcriptional regulator n=1 Tax=Hoeflea sp. TaxID=1940281 RepID=UPI003A8CCE10